MMTATTLILTTALIAALMATLVATLIASAAMAHLRAAAAVVAAAPLEQPAGRCFAANQRQAHDRDKQRDAQRDDSIHVHVLQKKPL
jgi:hypothetical protein